MQYVSMIRSFGDKETEKVWNGQYSKKLPSDIQPKARRKLRMINNAQDINDLRSCLNFYFLKTNTLRITPRRDRL